MDYSVLEKSDLFTGVSIAELRSLLKEIPHHIQCYNKGETIFQLLKEATQIGIIFLPPRYRKHSTLDLFKSLYLFDDNIISCMLPNKTT